MRHSAETRLLNDSGFTMSELIVVCSIIIILAAIVVPAYSISWLPDSRLKQAARELYSTMQLMKMTAVKKNQTENIVFSTAPEHQYQYTLSGVSKTVILSDYGSGVKYQHRTTADTYSTTPSPFAFDGRGFTNGTTNFFVYLSNDNNTSYYCVRLTPSGSISLQEHNGTDYN